MLSLNKVVFGKDELPEGADKSKYAILHDDRYRLYRHALQFYDVPNRHYHDELHVDNMLEAYALNFKHSMSDALFLAVIMHDAVYIPGRTPMSEEASAMLVPSLYSTVLGKPIPVDLYDDVYTLIRWTLPSIHVQNSRKHFSKVVDVNSVNREAAILLDLDLSGMSKPWPTFIKTQIDLDKEFSHLGTEEERRINSAKFLHLFIDKGFVYYTEEMKGYNQAALKNLGCYINEIQVNKNYDHERMKTFTRYDLRI